LRISAIDPVPSACPKRERVPNVAEGKRRAAILARQSPGGPATAARAAKPTSCDLYDLLFVARFVALVMHRNVRAALAVCNAAVHLSVTPTNAGTERLLMPLIGAPSRGGKTCGAGGHPPRRHGSALATPHRRQLNGPQPNRLWYPV